MRLIHLADLHIGKRVNDFSMIDDQRYILERILEITEDERPDAVLISGDVYDKPMPSADAVSLLDDFISRLSETGAEVFVISGNHDSAERLSFGSQIMDKQGIHFAGRYDGSTKCFTLSDEFGAVNFYMLPFIKPIHVRQAFSEDEKAAAITDFTEAVRYAVSRMNIDISERNVLLAHQFCTGAIRSDSEDISVGGLDNVDASVFKDFDYTALGHLHGPQNVYNSCGALVRYSGSPLKYSFSEAEQSKSVTVVDIADKRSDLCSIEIRIRELTPMRDLKVLRGRFEELTDNHYFKGIDTNDYMRIILTDEEDVIGALGSLRSIYPNIMRLEYDNTRTRAAAIAPDAFAEDGRSPLEIFAGLYEEQNGKPMDEEQTGLVAGLIEKIWSEEV